MNRQLTFRIVNRTKLVALRHGQMCWHYRAHHSLYIVGVTQGILIVRERLNENGSSVTDRVVGIFTGNGRPLWHAIHKGISEESEELYQRLLFLWEPNGAYATGYHIIVDVRSGKTLLTTDGDLKKKMLRELLYVNTPGPPPYQDRSLNFDRINPQTGKVASIHLALPSLPGIFFDEHPHCEVHVSGDLIEALYGGFQKSTSKPTYFLARYRWSAGNKRNHKYNRSTVQTGPDKIFISVWDVAIGSYSVG